MVYMGSKNRIAKYLCPIIQEKINYYKPDYYIEPFVGGANVIDKIKHNNKIGYDNNEFLIELLNYIKNGGELPDTYNKDFYNKVKENKDYFDKWLVGLVGFCTFSAKWFGGFPNAGNRDRINEMVRNLRKQAAFLKDITFVYKDFQYLNPDDFKHSVIYCDPPYKNTTKYGKENFNYELFYNWCRKLSQNNIVLISEYEMPSDFNCIWSQELKCSVQIGKQQKRNEKLFTLNN